MSAPRITVVGSANVDLVARCSRLPAPGETIGDASFARISGGKGANQAVAAARLGAAVSFVGRVGADDLALRSLEAESIDVSGVRRDDGESGVALILVDDEGENVIVVAPGANGRLAADDVVVGETDAVLCQLEIPLDAVQAAAEQASFFCLNAAPAMPVPAEFVSRADLVVVNRFELDALAGTPRLTALTLGAEGAVLLGHGREIARAAPPRVDAVDGTAAGDAFCAALLVYLLTGSDPEFALRAACVAGALAASRHGAQPSLPTAAEVQELLGA
ncbi:MAG: ribokinase [Gaiellaceae bacterium MAG52_C11]|nr:ribokinase [Candidatus Gaiellasilicea maunaloa]